MIQSPLVPTSPFHRSATPLWRKTPPFVGKVSVGPGASVWYGAVLRADLARHSGGRRQQYPRQLRPPPDEGMPRLVGEGVTVGHGAILHGCTIEDNWPHWDGAIPPSTGRSSTRDSMVGARASSPRTPSFRRELVLWSLAKVKRMLTPGGGGIHPAARPGVPADGRLHQVGSSSPSRPRGFGYFPNIMQGADDGNCLPHHRNLCKEKPEWFSVKLESTSFARPSTACSSSGPSK